MAGTHDLAVDGDRADSDPRPAGCVHVRRILGTAKVPAQLGPKTAARISDLGATKLFS
jgi:hypothetical protein